MHRAGVIADGYAGASPQADQLVEVGLPGQVDRLGYGLPDGLGQRSLRGGTNDHRGQAAFQQHCREFGEARRWPALDRPVRRTAGGEQCVRDGQGEVADVGVAPGQVGRRAQLDASLAELAELAVNIVQPVAVRIAVGQRAAVCDARPLRAAAVRQKLEVAAGSAGGLEVVGAVELALGEPPPEPEQPGEVPPFGALIDPDVVEPGRAGQPGCVGRGRQEGDVGAGMMAADRLEWAERQDDVAQGA